MNLFRPLLFMAILALLSGCVSEPMQEEYTPPPLMIAQNSDGDVSIAWKSDPEYVYSVFFQDSADSDWVTLRNAFRLRGTGQTITVYDIVNPNRPPRRYRILPEKPNANH